MTERRQMTRYDFGAIAEVVDLDSREDMIVITRDLSLCGCFVKTQSPFSAGTEVRIRITHGGSDFAATGLVTHEVDRQGMGIEFLEIEAKDEATIEKWLSVAALRDGHNPLKPGQVVRLKNRLAPPSVEPRLPSAESPKEPISRKPFAEELLASARNFWKFGSDARD